MLRSVMQDVRYTLRQWRRSPGFALTAVVVLALGLGANIAVFTLVSGIFLRPLPYADAGRIVSVQLPNDDPRFFTQMMPYADLLQLRDALGAGAQAAADYGDTPASVVGPGGRIQISNVHVDTNIFPLLGVEPALGRAFRADENTPGRTHVVLIGDAVWKRLFHADPAIAGRTLTIRGEAFTIVGVMPRGFSFPFDDAQQVWSPAEIAPATRTSMALDYSMGGGYFRIPAGMSRAQFDDILNRAQARIAQQVTDPANFARRVKVQGYQEQMNEGARKPLLLLYAVVAGIWVLACLNVTSLLLARAVARTREHSVRAALGASRLRLVQQSVVESLLLSAAGGVVGLLLAQVAIKLLWRQIKNTVPMAHAIHLDWRVVGALVSLTLVTALITGIVPALRASARDPREGLQGVTTTVAGSQNRMREALVVGQIALTLVFLVGAGLFLRTINALRAVPLGFSQQNVLTGGVILNGMSRLDVDDAESAKQPNIVQTKYLPLLDRLQAIPGVQTAALSSVLPMRSEFGVRIEAQLDGQVAKDSNIPSADGRIASSGMVEALGMPMLRGRFFTESDSISAPAVAVVNKAFADKYLPGKDPIGHTVSLGKAAFAATRIVGEIANVKQGDVTEDTRPELYFCLAQMTPDAPLYGITTAFMEVAIRAAVPADTLRAQFDRALHEVAPDATTTDVKTIHEAVEDSFGSETLTARLLEGFAALALMIASVGLYGLLSFTVAQRTREIGVRIALGAPRENIVGLVLRRAGLLVVFGLGIGAALAWFAVKLAHSYLFGVEAHDAVTFAAVIALLALAAFMAAWLPARRAAAVDPILALRSE